MRKLSLVLLIWGITANLFAQMQIPELTFIFNTQSEFTDHFSDKDHSKIFTFQVEGINNQLDAQALSHMVKEARGVEDFTLELTEQANVYQAKLKVYKYANGWWYWKTFMQKVGVPTFRIAGLNYSSESIVTIE